MITTNYLEISPAYGRDYKSAALAKQDWQDGKDFKMESIGQGGSYCSRRDFAAGTKVLLRYKSKQQVVEVKA